MLPESHSRGREFKVTLTFMAGLGPAWASRDLVLQQNKEANRANSYYFLCAEVVQWYSAEWVYALVTF